MAQLDDNANINLEEAPDQPYEFNYQRELGAGNHAMQRKAQRLVGNLAVMDGIRALISFQLCYALAFYCARF